MMLLTESIILIISAIILAKTAHIVIKSSVIIARITRLGELVVGSLILSIVPFNALSNENKSVIITFTSILQENY